MRSLLHQILLTSSHASLRYRAAWVLFIAAVVIGSIPGARAEAAQVASGLVLHSFSYAFLTFLLFTGGTGNRAQRAVKSVLTVMVMGAIDELVQSFFPYRHGTVGDWLVDTIAALVTATVFWVLWRRNRSAA